MHRLAGLERGDLRGNETSDAPHRLAAATLVALRLEKGYEMNPVSHVKPW